MTIRVERAYAAEPTLEGARFLVDRLWPRGVKKESLRLDGWMKEIAPSDRLRAWFGHDPSRWSGFRTRYFAELDAAADALAPLRDAANRGDVVLVYAAKDEAHNNAVALREYLANGK